MTCRSAAVSYTHLDVYKRQDSAYVQLENEGIAALDLGFPARYTHTPVEACNPEDIEQLARLIREMLGGMDETFRLPRY